MGDESDAGTQAPPVGSARGEAFNWLIDPHRESVPMAPPIETVPPPPAVAPRRHRRRTRSATSPVDWVAIVLAFLAPPLGILVGVGAVIAGLRLRGYATSVAKAAIGIGAVLTLVLGVALVVGTKVNADRAAHAAIVSSTNAYCTRLKSKPATLTSDTFGWPTPGDTMSWSPWPNSFAVNCIRAPPPYIQLNSSLPP